MQKTAKLLALFTVLLMAPASASAEFLCRCAYPSLEATICRNELAAKVFIWSGYTDGDTGNNVYVATVQQVYRGETAGRVITIEAPSSCGFEFRGFTNYAVSLQKGENGNYTTFACGSWVKPFRNVTRAEQKLLLNPECPPSCDDVTCDAGETCELQQVVCVRAPCYPRPVCVPDAQPSECRDYTGLDFGLCKMLMGWAVQDGMCRPISGCGSDLPFYASREECMAGCAVSADGVCYQFSESGARPFVNQPCEDGLKCTSTSNAIGFDSQRLCKPMDFCIDDSTAETDCEGIPPTSPGPGAFTCPANQCVWSAL